jgi:PAS domain S-box-containing protein
MATAHVPQLLHRKLHEHRGNPYAFAVLVVAMAFAVSKLLAAVTGVAEPFVPYLCAVLITSLVAGTSAGIFATLLSVPLVLVGHRLSEALSLTLLFAGGCAAVLYLSSLGTRARRAVETAEERLRLANEAAAISCWELDVASGAISWSPQPSRLRSCPRSLQGWLTSVHRDDRARFERAHARSLDPEGDGTIRSEFRVVDAEGAERWLSWVGRSYFREGADGRVPTRQIGTAIDVTHRRAHEDVLTQIAAELARSARQCRDLIGLAPDGYFLADLDHHIVEVNQTACRMLGYERKDLIGKQFCELLAPEEVPRINAAKVDLLTRDRVNMSEWTMQRKDGRRISVELSSNIVGDDHWQAFARDVTERKRIDDERKVFVALVENSSDFIGIIDPDGHPLYLNPAGRRMIELPANVPATQTRIAEYFPAELRDHASEVTESVRERGRWCGETHFRNRRTDQPIPVSDEVFKIYDASGTRLLGIGSIARDISAMQKATAQLRESEERFRLMFEQAPIGMALVALDGRFVRVNRAMCQLVGYTAEELQRLRFVDITHPDDREAGLALAEKLTRGEIPRVQLEKRYIHKDGSIVTVIVTAAILHGPNGDPLYSIAQITDITERKHTEEALRFSEARFSGIISISSEGIISIDENQRITLFNDGAERIFGYTRDEMIGAPVHVLLPERFRARHPALVAEFMRGPSVSRSLAARHSEVFGRRKSGEEFPIAAAISKLQIDDTITMTIVLRDITDQRRIEREQRFLAEAGQVLSSSLDYEQTLTTVGELAVRELANWCILQIAESEARPRRLRVIPDDPRLHPLVEEIERLQIDPTRPHIAKSVWDTQQPLLFEQLDDVEIKAFTQSPEHLRLVRALEARSMMAVPLTIRGRTLGVLQFVLSKGDRGYTERDIPFAMAIADRAALAIENGRHYMSAVQATQLRDQVLGVVAHDLRTPLSLIQLQASMLQRPPGAPERRDPKPAQMILRATDRMNRLIQDLLDVSRIEAGQLSIDRRPVSAADLVTDVVESERKLVNAAALELRLVLEHELPTISADRHRLAQVFENVIGNAIKFTPRGGSITVGARPLGDHVVFWVADTGAGIPPDGLGHVFDRFWQAKKGARHGAGLGLPISRGIVEAHGGRIWVESTLGCGSTFYFTIPVAPVAEPVLIPKGPGATM